MRLLRAKILEEVVQASCLDLTHGILDSLCLGTRCDQQSIGGVNHDDVVQANNRNLAIGISHNNAGATVVNDVILLAKDGQLLAALLGVEACHGVEVSNIIPAEGAGDHGDVAGGGGGPPPVPRR